jgi:ATP-dependent Clp protease ATP-binding subunit ClpC
LCSTLEKHDIDLIIEIELKKLYARLTELGYKLTLSEKAKAYCRKGFDTIWCKTTKKEPFKNTLKTHLPKRLLLLKFLQEMRFSWILKKELKS